MTTKARLRVVPPIAVELDEGRLRRQSNETGRSNVQGAGNGRPHHPDELQDCLMRARICYALLEEVFSNVRCVADIYETTMLDDIGLDELAYQLSEVRKSAERLAS
ncbi:hypothetical protein QM996_17900 [Sinorhizobium chiapasense]